MTRTGQKQLKHDAELIERALDAVRSKSMSIRKASAKFGIARTTLSDKLHGRTPVKPAAITLLTCEEERRLAQYILEMRRLGFGQTTNDIRQKAKEIMELRGAKPKNNDRPSQAWVYRFFERHTNISRSSPMTCPPQESIVKNCDAATSSASQPSFTSPMTCPRQEDAATSSASQPSFTSPMTCPPQESIEMNYSTMNSRQLEALKNICLFSRDELGRSSLLNYFRFMANGEECTEEGFKDFKNMCASVKSAFKDEPAKPASRGQLALEDILRVKRFPMKGKGKGKVTLPCVLSGKDHREAIMQKNAAKEETEKKKLDRKMEREESRRVRSERQEALKTKKEEAKKAREEKAKEIEKWKLEKKNLAVSRDFDDGHKRKTNSDTDKDVGDEYIVM